MLRAIKIPRWLHGWGGGGLRQSKTMFLGGWMDGWVGVKKPFKGLLTAIKEEEKWRIKLNWTNRNRRNDKLKKIKAHMVYYSKKTNHL